MVVVGPAGVRVHAVGHHQPLRPVLPSEGRAEGDAVDAAAPVPVVGRVGGVAVEDAVAVHVGGEVRHHLAEVNGRHHAVRLGVHPDPVHGVDVEDRYVERLFRLVLQRPVDPAVRRVQVDVAEVPRQSLDGAEDVALQIGLHQHLGERPVDEAAFAVDGDALHVAGRPRPAVDGGGQPARPVLLRPVLLRGGERRCREGDGGDGRGCGESHPGLAHGDLPGSVHGQATGP